MMRVGIIGTLNKDKLVLPSGAVVASWGGIAYNILTLRHYLAGKGSVRPICLLGPDGIDDATAMLDVFNNVELDGLKRVAQKQNRVLLKCKSHEDKEETADLSLPPIPFDHIEQNIEDLDFLLVNFTSGNDIEKETLRNLRAKFENPMLVDVHSLTLNESDARGKRRLRAFHDWQEWLEGVDYVQLSWKEAASLTQETTATLTGLVEVAKWLLEKGAKGVLITRGEAGAYYFYMDEDGIQKYEIPPFKLHSIVDTTGCGDVFSAAFISYLLLSGDVMKAGLFAVKAAAMKATFSGLGPWLAA